MNEYAGKYFFYSYSNSHTRLVFGLDTINTVTTENDVCTNNHPFVVCANYSVNNDKRTIISWQEITEKEYKIFKSIIVKR